MIVWFSESVKFSVEYVMPETSTSLIEILIVADIEPAELLAQMVNTAPGSTTVGVPQIVPLLVSKVSPVGGVALIAQEVTLPLVLVFVKDGVTGVIAESLNPMISE